MHWIDPNSLSETRGNVVRFLYNTHGDADGFMLDGNREVHVPPRLSTQLLRKVKIGDSVGVRGVKPRGVDMVAAVAVIPAHGKQIMDEGPGWKQESQHPKRSKSKVEIDGIVQTTLHAPKGEVSGGVLASGDIVRMAPKENAALAHFFTVGSAISVWGDAITIKGQRIVDLKHVALQP